MILQVTPGAPKGFYTWGIQNGWFIMENRAEKWDGFGGNPISGNFRMGTYKELHERIWRCQSGKT